MEYDELINIDKWITLKRNTRRSDFVKQLVTLLGVK